METLSSSLPKGGRRAARNVFVRCAVFVLKMVNLVEVATDTLLLLLLLSSFSFGSGAVLYEDINSTDEQNGSTLVSAAIMGRVLADASRGELS